MAARQANTGPGIRRVGGGITTKRPLARNGEEETGRASPLTGTVGFRGLGQLWSPSPQEGGFALPWLSGSHLSAHFLQLSSFLAGPRSKAREPGAGVEPG